MRTGATETDFVRRLNHAQSKMEPWLMKQLDVLACERDLLQSATTLAELASDHVLNEHNPPSITVQESLSVLRRMFRDVFAELTGAARPDPPISRTHRRTTSTVNSTG